MKLSRLAVLGGAIAVAVVLTGVGRPDRASGDTPVTPVDRTITVSGSGAVSATPNQAVFTFGVTTQGKTAVQALAANSTEMRRLIDALKAAGVLSGSLQTSSVSLSPILSDGGDAIVGYSASNSIAATIASLGRAGEIVDAAVAAGANQVQGPNLTVSDQSALYQAALKAAVADARLKAQALAEASGLRIGGVTSVQENGGNTPITYDAKAAPAPSTPIVAGTQQISASVTVVFEASTV
jgi:uncharacterized protein YggE